MHIHEAKAVVAGQGCGGAPFLFLPEAEQMDVQETTDADGLGWGEI